MDHQSHNANESSPFKYPETEASDTRKSPTPEGETFGSTKVEEASANQAIERGQISSPSQSTSSTAVPLDFPNNPLLSNVPAAPASTSTTTVSPTSDLAAADSDVIEKVWVEKAKAIIAQTRTDPHKQTSEINKIKADYQKKRYNRDLQINVE